MKNGIPLAQVLSGVYPSVAGRIHTEGRQNPFPRTIADNRAVRSIRSDVAHGLSFHDVHPSLAGMVEQHQVKIGPHRLKTAPVLVWTIIRGARLGRTPTHAVTSHTQKAGLFHLRSDAQKVEQRENAGRQGLANLMTRKTALFKQDDAIAETSELVGDGRPGRAATGNHNVC